MSPDHEPKSITCPQCGAQIDVNALLYQQVEDELRKSYDSRLAKEQKKLETKSAALAQDQKALEEEREALKDNIEAGVKKQLQAEKQKLETQLRKTIIDETSEERKAMQEELARKSEQVKELNKAKSDIARLTREKDELKDTIEADAQRKMNDILKV